MKKRASNNKYVSKRGYLDQNDIDEILNLRVVSRGVEGEKSQCWSYFGYLHKINKDVDQQPGTSDRPSVDCQGSLSNSMISIDRERYYCRLVFEFTFCSM